MTREEIKTKLGENATEEQISAMLNLFHSENEKNKKLELEANESQSLKKELESYKSQIQAIEKEKMTEQEKLDLEKQEIAKNLKESKLLLSKAKAKEILAQAEINDDETIDMIANEDLEITEKRATKMVEHFKALKEKTAKETKESLFNEDLKPSGSNNLNNDDKTSKEKYEAMSREEKGKFAKENPEEFAKIFSEK